MIYKIVLTLLLFCVTNEARSDCRLENKSYCPLLVHNIVLTDDPLKPEVRFNQIIAYDYYDANYDGLPDLVPIGWIKVEDAAVIGDSPDGGMVMTNWGVMVVGQTSYTSISTKDEEIFDRNLYRTDGRYNFFKEKTRTRKTSQIDGDQ